MLCGNEEEGDDGYATDSEFQAKRRVRRARRWREQLGLQAEETTSPVKV